MGPHADARATESHGPGGSFQFAVIGTTSVAGHGSSVWVAGELLGRVRAGLGGPRSDS